MIYCIHSNRSLTPNSLYTVFIRIVAVDTINFSLAGVQLLIKGSYYYNVTSDWYLTVLSIKIVPQKTGLWGMNFKYSRHDRQRSSHAALEPSQGHFCHASASNEWSFMTYYRDRTHLIEFVHAYSYYLRSATISLAELQVRLLFEGGYIPEWKMKAILS